MQFDLEGFAGYGLRSSPFESRMWAVATAANFGIVGNGRLYIVREAVGREGTVALEQVCAYNTNGGLYDCAWSEQAENHVLCASTDGSVKLYDLAASTGGRPINAFCEHQVAVRAISNTALPSLIDPCVDVSRRR